MECRLFINKLDSFYIELFNFSGYLCFLVFLSGMTLWNGPPS